MFNTDEKLVIKSAADLFDSLERGGLDKDCINKMKAALRERLASGKNTYGDLEVATDSRKFEDEAGAEACDFIVYALAYLQTKPEKETVAKGAAMMVAMAWAGISRGRTA